MRKVITSLATICILALTGCQTATTGNATQAVSDPPKTSETPAPPTPEPTKAPPTATLEPTSTPTPVPPTDTPMPTPTNTLDPSLGIGSTMLSEKDGMTMVFVPAGEFAMGLDLEGTSWVVQLVGPKHLVYLDAYWIDQTEVANGMYALCVADGVCNPPTKTVSLTREAYFGNPEFDNYPVVYVTWDDAKTYCSWAGRRLPTEAEWEKAARGADERLYPWGNNEPTCALANFSGCVGDTSPVDSYPAGASPYGALGMTGNVDEWVWDYYSTTYYASSPYKNPKGTRERYFEYHSVRGSTFLTGLEGQLLTVVIRVGTDAPETAQADGFRCAMNP